MPDMDEERLERRQLRRELTLREDQIRSNERIWSGFRRIEIDMVGTHSLGQLLDVLADGILTTFSNVDYVTVACTDPEYEMRRLLANGEDTGGKRVFVPVEAAPLAELFSSPFRPRLGQYHASTQAFLFPGTGDAIRSVALAPLVLQGRLIGSLNEASRKAGHYRSDAATDLLEHLAAITAMCIDNVISHERLKLDGLTDALTGIANRRFFQRRLEEEVDRWARTGNTLLCILADIDHFKQVNDHYGHQTGDVVLERVAQELGKDLRGSDVLARYGGEEFILLLPDTSETMGREIAERLRVDIARMVLKDEGINAPDVTVSLGLASLKPGVMPAGTVPAEWLVQQADAALYEAKRSGRNRVVMAGA